VLVDGRRGGQAVQVGVPFLVVVVDGKVLETGVFVVVADGEVLGTGGGAGGVEEGSEV